MQIIFPNTRNDTLYYQQIPVFIYTIHYPVFTSTCSAAAAHIINTHYASFAKEQELYCRTVLYPQAVEAARYISDNNPPFHSYEFNINYQITYNTDCITSLFFETYTYMGGAHGSTIRSSDTWNFASGKKLELRDFYPRHTGFVTEIQENIKQQISNRLEIQPASFFPDYAKLLQDSFDTRRYYLTPDGIILYYQQYDIAPYSSGIPEFLLPVL